MGGLSESQVPPTRLTSQPQTHNLKKFRFSESKEMLAKLSSKNQVTIPKRITQALGPFEYLEVEALGDRIVLTPVRLKKADAVRNKLNELGIDEGDVAGAVNWARAAQGSSEPNLKD